MYYGFRKEANGFYKRKTKEVYIEIELVDNTIKVNGRGDLEHHLIEDTIILLKKILGGHENL